MKTIEDYMRVAFDLGKIAGAAETIEDEYTRDSIYGSACELLDEVIREASKIETECQHAKGIVQSTPDRNTNFARITQSPGALVGFLMEGDRGCPFGSLEKECDPTSDCNACWLGWLEATPND